VQQLYGEREFRDWFEHWTPAVETGTREIYHIID
jgi:hypothetical protein